MEVKLNTNRCFKNWIINTLRFYSQRTVGKLVGKRNPKLWVFSAWEGTKYSDNTRYLFEYINQYNEKEITCVWMTKSDIAFSQVVDAGYKACMIGTLEAKKIQGKAGVAVCTHGMDDFGDFPNIFGACIVNLSHGAAGMKKTYYGLRKSNILHRILSETKGRIFDYWYRDITITTSAFCREVFRTETLLHNDMPVIGLPRNDFLNNEIKDLSEVLSEFIIERYCLKNDMPILTYMPTYRPTKKSQEQLERYIAQISSNERLNGLLNRYNAKLFMKMHYLTDISNITFNENIILLKDSDIVDVQKLLQLTKALITDYSGCATDYALKNRPIILFTPDLDDYMAETGIYKEYVDILHRCHVESIDELIDAIEDCFKNRFSTLEAVKEINKIFNERALEVGTFRQMTYEYICNKLEI